MSRRGHRGSIGGGGVGRPRHMKNVDTYAGIRFVPNDGVDMALLTFRRVEVPEPVLKSHVAGGGEDLRAYQASLNDQFFLEVLVGKEPVALGKKLKHVSASVRRKSNNEYVRAPNGNEIRNVIILVNMPPYELEIHNGIVHLWERAPRMAPSVRHGISGPLCEGA